MNAKDVKNAHKFVEQMQLNLIIKIIPSSIEKNAFLVYAAQNYVLNKRLRLREQGLWDYLKDFEHCFTLDYFCSIYLHTFPKNNRNPF